MPDDLDPTTARLVSELSAMILPPLVKAVTSAIPSADLNGAIQDLRLRIERMKDAIRSGIDDSRAGRSMIMQSIGTLLEEISGLRLSIERIHESLESAKTNNEEISQSAKIPEAITEELDGISRRVDALTQGITSFFETYAVNRENDAQVPEVLRASFDPDVLSGLEGLVRAEGKSHSHELAELSREISAMTEENNTALIHEVREAVAEEISGIGSNSETDTGNDKLLRIVAWLSGACLAVMLLNVIILLLK